ncbi:MAG: hypothetical protein U0263_20935 [Polyangiaceae bacterium]
MLRARAPHFVRALRALAGVIALFLISGQLLSIGHHALVAHYLCAEHGTVHHGRAPELRAVAHGKHETARPVAASEHGSHDDCAFPSREPEQRPVAESTRVVGEFAVASLVFEPADVAAHASVPLLSLAPKLSPPIES